jgi:hypothetical protein
VYKGMQFIIILDYFTSRYAETVRVLAEGGGIGDGIVAVFLRRGRTRARLPAMRTRGHSGTLTGLGKEK